MHLPFCPIDIMIRKPLINRHVYRILSHWKQADTNILAKFPCAVSRAVSTAIVQNLYDARDYTQTQVSAAHMLWSMECVGHCFSWSFDDHALISNALDVYSRWIFAPHCRPAPFNADENTYYQIIFLHVSQLFEPLRRHRDNTQQAQYLHLNQQYQLQLQQNPPQQQQQHHQHHQHHQHPSQQQSSSAKHTSSNTHQAGGSGNAPGYVHSVPTYGPGTNYPTMSHLEKHLSLTHSGKSQ